MSGPTLQLNITAPGQKNVEASVSAVERLAAALRDLPKASSELLKLQKALQGASTATGGLKGGAGDLKELVGEIKNLGAQLNTSFASLEATIQKGWGRAAAAQEAGAAKAAGAGKKGSLPMLARQALEQAEALSKAQAVGDRRRLKSASGSEGATQQLLYGTDVSAQEKLRNYYQGLVDAERAGVARLEAEYQKSISKLDAVVPKVIKAATREGYAPAGPAWWDKVLADQRAATAKLEAEYQKSISKLDAVVPKVIKAATREGYAPAGPAWWDKVLADQRAATAKLEAEYQKSISKLDAVVPKVIKAARREGYQPAGAAWWDKVLAEQEAALLKTQKLNAKFAAASAAGQASTVLAARSQLNQGVAPAAVAQSFGPQALAAAQATTFSQAYDAVHASVRKGNDEIAKAPPKMLPFTASMRDAHSAARGLASSFGAMYLTYGAVLPLLAGAAVGRSFVDSIKIGAGVRQDLETMRVLSQESTQAVADLERQLISLGQNGPFGPREAAEAMKVLSLAGLGAAQVGTTIKPALDLAVVGQTTIEKSASTLVAVGTAYGYQAEQFGLVGDAMSKAAAISMSSVDGMMESFRSASVVGQQYKVSLNDTATALAILANVGIRNSAAGTSVRQMYSELSGASSNTRRAMKQLGVDVLDTATGGMKPLLTIVRELNVALGDRSAAGYQRAIQDMSNERGAKSLVALLEAFSTKAKEAGSTVENELDRIQQAITNAPGFSAVSSAQLAATPLNQMKSVVSSFQTALLEAFKAIEPTLMVLTARMKEAFASPVFRDTVASLATAVGNLSLFLTEQIGLLGTLAGAYLVWKGASAGFALTGVAVGALTTLYYGNAVAAGVAGAAAGSAAVAAKSAWLSFLGPIGVAVGAGAALWTVYQTATADASKGELDAARVRNDVVLQSLAAEAKRLDEVNDKLRVKLGLERQAAGKSSSAEEPSKLEDEYTRLQKREKFLLASPAVGAVKESQLAELGRVRSAMEQINREMYDYGRRVAEGTVAVTQKSQENAALTVKEQRIFGDVGPDNSREEARLAREAAAAARAAEAERKKNFDGIRQMYENQQALLQTYYARDEEAYKLLAKAKSISEDAYLAKSAERQAKYFQDQQANLERYEAQLAAKFRENQGDKSFLASKEYGDLALARAKAKADSDTNFLKNFAQTADISRFEKSMDNVSKVRLPAVGGRAGTPTQLMLDDWQNTQKLLADTREEFTQGFIERGRTMWADWLKNGKISFASLKELALQTFADITYKRFIAAPMANLGNAFFDKILGPAATQGAGTGGVDKSFSTLEGTVGRLTQSLGSLGSSFWQLFVQAGQGLAVMLSSSSSGAVAGIGGWLGKLFAPAAGSAGGSSIPAGEMVSASGWAKGGAFGPMQMFAKGDLFNSPHIFRFGAGGSQLGMLGEAGPEAIMPLTRGPGGSLGVRNYGNGGGGGRPVTNVSVVVEKHGDGNGPVTQTKESQPDGSELIRVVLNETAKDISRGGVVRKSMQTTAGRGNLPRY